MSVYYAPIMYNIKILCITLYFKYLVPEVSRTVHCNNYLIIMI